MAQPKITLYVDVVSPFAYMAYHILRHDRAFTQCDISYVPVFLGGIMKECGNTAPLRIKNKDKWIERERIRWANLFNVPIASTVPPGFPTLTVLPMRVLCVWPNLHPGKESMNQILDEFYRAFWVEHRPLHDPETLLEVLTKLVDRAEAEKLLELAKIEGKELLNKTTQDALGDGAFGLPWFHCTNAQGKRESFWGIDHIGQMCIFLGIELPAQGGWKAVL